MVTLGACLENIYLHVNGSCFFIIEIFLHNFICFELMHKLKYMCLVSMSNLNDVIKKKHKVVK